MKENIDNISQLWLPDRELCAEQDEYRKQNEWMRAHNGLSGMRPTDMGIEQYRYADMLHDKFYEGRIPPPVALDSMENLEWYEEQLSRCVYGFEYKGQRITGDHYWLLNFTPFLVAKKDSRGKVTKEFDILFPYYSIQHDYIFKSIEQAHFESKGFMWMSGRASGKTYSVLSIIAKIYHLKPKSHSIVSASHSGHANEAFQKMLMMVDSIAEVHPTMALNRLQDTKSLIESGQEVTRDGVKFKEGPRSRIQKVIYGDNPGATRGGRPDIQLFEEVGDWSKGAGDLKSCIGASIGSWFVGSIKKCRVFMIGTGGSVSSDQAKDVFHAPSAYDLLPFSDFKPKTSFFLPSHYLLGGKGWEESGVNDNEGSKVFLEKEREKKKEDMEIYQKFVQEYPYTIEEVFRKSGTNIFNQRKIAQQWTDLHYEKKELRPKRGYLDWVKTPNGLIKSVKWSENPEGNIEITEHPFRGKGEPTTYPDLYVIGVDSIDMGSLDSTSEKDRSSLACLVKKRIVDGQFFQQSSNLYVAKYVGRSKDVRWDYEETLKLTLYYNGKVNVEYTRIGIVSYFRELKQYHRLMKRPMVALPSAGAGEARLFGLERTQNLIGTPATTYVIDHQDSKIKEYVEDYYDRIYFMDLLEQLRDYQREDRTKYDLVIAMGLCELADEDMLGIAAKPERTETADFKMFGYFKDPKTGFKRFGTLPSENPEERALTTVQKPYTPDWVDLSGKPRFDKRFDILDEDDILSKPTT